MTITGNNTRLFLLAFVALTAIPMLVNIHILSIFTVDKTYNEAAPIVSDYGRANSKNRSNNDLPILDFAIIGFAKTGTTFLHDILANHSQVIMYDDEFWGDGNGLRQWLNKTAVMKTHQTPTRRGIKCPRIVKETARLDQLLNNTSRVIVGVRHPVHWFESLYNYRIWQKHEKKRFKNKPTMKFLHNNRTDWLGLSTGAARFDLYLKQLGKVPLTSHEMFNMKLVNNVHGIMSTTSHHREKPLKVFLYSKEQIKDSNVQRRLQFQETLQEFLNLDSPLLQHDIASEPKVNVNTFEHNENIDICGENYTNIRNTLVWQGKHASEWIRNKFMKSEDVIVSDVDFMNESLETWGVDPCEGKQ